MMLGGSPHIVAEPPRFAQKISERIIGTGFEFQEFGKLDGYGCQEQDNRDTVDEHGQYKG